jgi:hypothetical protein
MAFLVVVFHSEEEDDDDDDDDDAMVNVVVGKDDDDDDESRDLGRLDRKRFGLGPRWNEPNGKQQGRVAGTTNAVTDPLESCR